MPCQHCGRPTSASAARCPHCGQWIKTVAPRTASTIECAHCNVAAHIVTCGSVELDVCDDCGTTWFDKSEFESAAAAADGGLGADFRDTIRGLSPTLRTFVPRTYVACPMCSAPLLRRMHPQVAGVVAHCCVDHGAWVERRHLLLLLDEIERLGAAELTRRRVRLAKVEEDKRDADYRAWLEYDRWVTHQMLMRMMHF